MSLLDTRVPAVLLRIDRNPFHHGTLGAARSLGRAGVEVHVVADSAGSPVARVTLRTRICIPRRRPGASPDDIARRAAPGGRPDRASRRPGPDGRRERGRREPDARRTRALLPAARARPAPWPNASPTRRNWPPCARPPDVPHPETLVPDSPAEAADAARRLGLPVVAKWSRPWLLPAGSGLRSTVLVRSAQEARELYLRTEEAGSRLLLQAYLPPGPDRDWFFHGYADHAGDRARRAAPAASSWPGRAGRA